MSSWPQPELPAQWTGAPSRPPLVGRTREFERLEELWESVEQGCPQTVFVGGEPGAGKSRLAAEAGRAVHTAGGAVLAGWCGAELGRPYDPFVRPVRRLLESVDAGHLGGPELPVGGGQEVDRLRAVVGPVAAGDAPDRSDTSAVAQLEALEAVLRAACAERPVLLVLEDLHWAGESALRMLRHVVEHVDSARMLVLATHRTTPPDRSDALSEVVAALVRRDDVHRLDLGPLEVVDIAGYLVACGAGDAAEVRGVASLLRDHTGGNPFVLREVWSDLSSRGGLTAVSRGAVAVPDSLRSVIGARLAALPPEQRRLICMGAVIGEEFEADVVTAAAGGGADLAGTYDALAGAEAVGLVEPTTDRPGRFRFAHALAQQAVQAELAPYELAAAHAAVAEALRARGGDDGRRVLRLAHHYSLAAGLGLEEEAEHHLRLAAEAAERQKAFSDAARLYERGAGHAGSSVRRDRLLLDAARCHTLGGRRLRALELDDEVARSEDPELRLLGAIGYEAACWRAGAGAPHAVALLRRAVDTSGLPDDHPLVIRATGALAAALSMSGMEDEGRQAIRRALAQARSTGDVDLLVAVLDSAVFTGWGVDTVRDRALEAEELSRLALDGRHWTSLSRAAGARVQTSYVLGDRRALLESVDHLALAARETRQPYLNWLMASTASMLRFLSGDVTALRGSIAVRERLDAEFEPELRQGDGAASLQEFMVRRESGDLEVARRLLESGVDVEMPWRPGVVALCTELGMAERAARALGEALRYDLPALRASASWPASLSFLGEGAAELGDRPSMERLLPEAERYRGLNLVGSEMLALLGSGDLLVAVLRSGLGRPGVEQAFEASLEMDRRVGSVLHEATTHAHWAVHLRRAGAAADRVREHERPARAAAQRYGLARVLRILGPETPEAAPDGLTAREVEVLRLLAEGASNRDVATRLVISEHTAANHVRSILMKTQSPNRTAAARYAARHGLLGDASDDRSH